MPQFSPGESDEPLGVPGDSSLAIARSVAVHLPGAGDSPADERLVKLILESRPGILFVAASVG